MTQVRDVLGRARPLAVAALFTAAAIIPALSIHFASADALTSRSLKVTSSVESGDLGAVGLDPGAPGNGDEVGHTYTFTTGENTMNVEGISFEVCASAFGYLETAVGNVSSTCAVEDLVSGFDVTATGTFTGVEVNGVAFDFTKVDSSYWTLTNATGVSLTANTAYTITFDPTATAYFTNPDTANTTFFVHIALYGDSSAVDYDDDFVENSFDEGTVTSATATAIDINTRVQETLKFSVEGDMRNGTPNVNTGAPQSGVDPFNGAKVDAGDCTPLDGQGTILMGTAADRALASNVTYDAMSYFRIATNSAHGTIVYYSGETLQSGTEEIDALGATAVEAATGDEQFGLAFDVSSGSNDMTRLVAETPYLDGSAAGANEFAFETATSTSNAPVELATSPGVIECDTGAVRYIANIAEETAAGIYETRIVYIASPSY